MPVTGSFIIAQLPDSVSPSDVAAIFTYDLRNSLAVYGKMSTGWKDAAEWRVDPVYSRIYRERIDRKSDVARGAVGLSALDFSREASIVGAIHNCLHVP
jgi:hypothetical protein